MTHCTICGDAIPGSDHTDEAWYAGCFEVNLAYTLEPGQGLGWQHPTPERTTRAAPAARAPHTEHGTMPSPGPVPWRTHSPCPIGRVELVLKGFGQGLPGIIEDRIYSQKGRSVGLCGLGPPEHHTRTEQHPPCQPPEGTDHPPVAPS